MKTNVLILLFLLLRSVIVGAQDLIILRNGEDILCKVEKIDNGIVSYQSDGQTTTLPVTQIYLIKYENRGNAFFNEAGETTYSTRVTTKPSKKDILVYLCNGNEIRSTELEITAEYVRCFDSKAKTSKKSSEEWISLPKEEVFLVRYPDGTKDIVTNLQKTQEESKEELLPKCKHPFITINKSAGYPVLAELTLNDNKEISVIIYDSDRSYIYYRTKEWQDGPIYRLNLNKIRLITTITVK